jgi:hypothetical protein
MTGNPKNHDDAVRDALLAGDPAAGDEILTVREQQAMRDHLARADASASRTRSRAWTWRPALAAVGTLLVLITVFARYARDDRPVPTPGRQATPTPLASRELAALSLPPPPAEVAVAAAHPTPSPRRARPVRTAPQLPEAVRMITSGGTRIVWVVNPVAKF